MEDRPTGVALPAVAESGGPGSGRVPPILHTVGVRIFRFDPEVSVPITDHGSEFRICPLTAPAAWAAPLTVQAVHVPAGGRMARHPASARQLFAVMAGSGWVTGGDGAERRLRPGHAVLWEAGEDHDARSDDGLTAVVIEGAFEVLATAVTQEIVVTDYDPAWADWFEQLRAFVWPAVESVAVRIDHVGSTAVGGLAGKPVIDMDVVVAGEDDVRPAIDRLAVLGYRWRGDLGVAGRQAFAPPASADLPRHHLYLVVEDDRPHLDHWLLRDLLRSDPAARDRYAELKRRNAEMAQGDMEYYVEAKAGLVAELLGRARAERGLPPVEYWQPEPADEPPVG